VLPPLPRAQYVAISTRPPVFVVWDYAIEHPRAQFFGLLETLADHLPHVCYWPSWRVDESEVDRHLERLRWLHTACCGASVTVMGQSRAETGLFLARGVDALHCNQNALADERVFRPLPFIEKRFTAIYDAKLERYKRHYLAKRVPNLALLAYRNPGTGSRRYAEAVAREFETAHWLNDPTRTPAQWALTDAEVNALYNRCHVGLCLSAIEGPMWASIQYLLAGLPVVSTPSEGGRDEFFAAPHVRIVAATPDAVAAGVAELKSAELDPAAIRERTLAMMAPQRARFIEHVQALFDARGEARRFADDWSRVIRHRVVDMRLLGFAQRRAIAEHDAHILAAVAERRAYPDERRPAAP
jgi:hypothetical protein